MIVYDFKVVSSVASTFEPGDAYFKNVERAASHALLADVVEEAQAVAGCEYLDCVDGEDIQMNKALYRQCMALVAGYLLRANTSAAQTLAARSWAAKTIFDVLQEDQFANQSHRTDARPALRVA